MATVVTRGAGFSGGVAVRSLAGARSAEVVRGYALIGHAVMRVGWPPRRTFEDVRGDLVLNGGVARGARSSLQVAMPQLASLP